MKRRQFLAAATGAWLLGACAAVAPSNESLPWPVIERFVIGGRLSLRHGERRDHVSFEWSHSAHHDAVLFLSPLGQGLAELTRDETGARLTRAQGESVAAKDLAELAERLFGTHLPLAAVAEWLRGARGVAGMEEGWQVAVTQWAPPHQRRVLQRLKVSRDDVELILIVDEWMEAQ